MVVRFPSWRYHKTERAVIVANEADAFALGPGWFDNQAEADAYVAEPESGPESAGEGEGDPEDDDEPKKKAKRGR